MTKAQAMKKVREMIVSDRKFSLERCERLLDSGALDLTEYNKDEYLLSKIVLYAALGDLREQRRPLYPKHIKEANNLRHF